jgi:hypothetical protein
MKIERTLFWFEDGDESLTDLDNGYFGWGTMLNRLLNQVYDGKKIKFININFITDQTYEQVPAWTKNSPYYFRDHLTYYGSFDRTEFNNLPKESRVKFVWEMGCKYLKEIATAMRNQPLYDAVDYAYNEGLRLNLNPDYRMIDSYLNIFGLEMRASIWVNFTDQLMISKLTLEKDDRVVFEKEIGKAKLGFEIFLEMYKGIEVSGDSITIKGRRDVKESNVKILLDASYFKGL